MGRGLEEALTTSGALRVLLALLDRAPLGATELTDAIGGYTAQGITAARSLERFGLVRVEEVGGFAGKPAYAISLTERGEKVARHLRTAAELVPDASSTKATGAKGLPRAKHLDRK